MKYNEYETISNLIASEMKQTKKYIRLVREQINRTEEDFPGDLEEHYHHYSVLCAKMEQLYSARIALDKAYKGE